MNYNAKKILTELVDKYDRSVMSKQGSNRKIQQKFNITKNTLPKYFSTNGFSFREQLNVDLMTYQENGWVELDYDDDVESIYSVTLNTDKIEEINRFLDRKSRNDKEKELLNLFEDYQESNIQLYVKDIISRINNYESYLSLVLDTIEENQDLLVALNEILKLNHEEMERVFSVRVLKDSKKFQKIKSKIVHILKQYYNAQGEDDEILADYNIIKNPSSISLKGKGIISINESNINLEDFGKEFILSTYNIPSLKIIDLPIKRVITVENLTSFYTIELEDTLFIYLGGYHNHSRRKLLKLIYEYDSNLEYYHFGDIDAGGIYIFEHLKNKTEIPFKPYMMDINTIKEYEAQTISLTNNDVQRLKKIDSPQFKDLIRFMIDSNCKLEQENISEYLRL